MTLRDLREARDLRREDVASAVNASVSQIAMLELGKREPSLKLLRRLADFYNLSLSEMDALIPSREVS